MLARASSDAGTRLRRSKSTSTVQKHTPSAREHLDPDIAQQHAVAAATAAFVRAHDTSASENKQRSSLEFFRTKSCASRKSLTSQGSHFPPRESSMHPGHPSKGIQAPGTLRQGRETTTTTGRLVPFHPTPASTLSNQPSIKFNENIRPSTQPKMARASASSSIASQQIRKARSMYYASSVQTGSPVARPPAKYLTTPPPTSISPAFGSAPQMPSFKRPATSPLSSSGMPVKLAPDETVDTARDKYLQSFREPQIKHKPSLFLAPFKKRQNKTKKESAPASSSAYISSGGQQIPENQTPCPTTTEPQPLKEQREKRSFSNSLKTKIKKVFRRTSTHATTMPVQQIEASREYFSSLSRCTLDMHNSLEVPNPDGATLQRARSRTSSFEAAPPVLTRPGSGSSNRSVLSARSNRSLHGETAISIPSTSRVTSWGASSASGTLSQRDIKRLTVIHEAKDSISSEVERFVVSSSPNRNSSPTHGLAAFREPMHMDSLVEERSTPVDPKRVFSALMKEINATKAAEMEGLTILRAHTPGGESDVFVTRVSKGPGSVTSRDMHSSASKECRVSIDSDQRPPSRRRLDAVSGPRKSSSIRSFIKSTIRTVTPSEKPFPPAREHTASVRGAVRIPRPGSATSSTTSSIPQNQDNPDSTLGSIKLKLSSLRSRLPVESPTEKLVTSSTKHTQKRVERSLGRWKSALDESQIPVLPRPTERTFAVSNFMKHTCSYEQSMEDAGDINTPPTNDSTAPVQRIGTPTSPKSPRSKPFLSPVSPSVYSRNTDGVSILPNESNVSLKAPKDSRHNESGSAIIVKSEAVKSYVIGTPSPKRGDDSARSSRDWKAWLAHEVSELGSPPHEDIMIQEQYTPSGRHYREFSQIQNEDAIVTVRESIEIPTPRQHTATAAITEQDIPHFSEAFMSEEHHPIPGPSSLQERVTSTPSRPGSTQTIRDTSNSARMNDRFPYIDTGRRSSNHSTPESRQSRTPTDKGSSSSRSKHTPSPKVYSEYSIRPANRTSWTLPKSPRVTGNTNESNKENLTASPSKGKKPNFLTVGPSPIRIISRPKSLHALSSASLNCSPSNLAQYTASTDDIERAKPGVNTAVTPSRRRMRTQPRPLPKGRGSVRPKSAFDLRGATTSPLIPAPLKFPNPSASSPNKRKDFAPPRASLERNSVTGRELEADIVCMPLESLWAASGSPSARSSLEVDRPRRLPLHVKRSSSQLALNKEPSPGAEERNIDSVIDEETCASARAGSVTPGHRMAERVLRQRTTGSGAGSPASGLVREDTPAFL